MVKNRCKVKLDRITLMIKTSGYICLPTNYHRYQAKRKVLIPSHQDMRIEVFEGKKVWMEGEVEVHNHRRWETEMWSMLGGNEEDGWGRCSRG